eukprot:12859055-Heterocapsa_arctica.AAC.1
MPTSTGGQSVQWTADPPEQLRVKWVPSHMEEVHVREGITSREHLEGNQEADKLATLGVEMHKVSDEQVEEVRKQDELVEGLLQMLLKIMKNVHEKTPARKKEDKQKRQEVEKKFHGPKTGPHGEHNCVEREEGGWK